MESICVSGSSTHMNEGEVGAPTLAAGYGLGAAPSPIKGSPPLTSHSHLLVKYLSPPLVLFSHGLGLGRYMFSVDFYGARICCFRCIARARTWRLSGLW